MYIANIKIKSKKRHAYVLVHQFSIVLLKIDKKIDHIRRYLK